MGFIGPFDRSAPPWWVEYREMIRNGGDEHLDYLHPYADEDLPPSVRRALDQQPSSPAPSSAAAADRASTWTDAHGPAGSPPAGGSIPHGHTPAWSDHYELLDEDQALIVRGLTEQVSDGNCPGCTDDDACLCSEEPDE